jgi:hypothetical protein
MNVPTNTGTAIAGITVDLQSPGKEKTTKPTKIKLLLAYELLFSIEASKI